MPLKKMASTGDPGGAQAAAISLFDLPAPWLQQLVETFGPKSGEDGVACLLALFRSCRFMRDLVLSLHHVRLEVSLPVPPDQEDAIHFKLLLACKHPSSRVKLHMEQQGQGPAADRSARMSAGLILFSAMRAAAGQGLTTITHVNLTGLLLVGSLVPPWLRDACPRITALHLERCTLQGLPASCMTIPVYSSLTELRLDSHALPDSPGMTLMLQHQLRALPNLTSLSTQLHEPDPHLQQLQCFSVIGAQINTLNLTCAAAFHLGALAAWFPNLRDLHMAGAMVDDADMEVLLSLKQLRVLGCAGFDFKESYADSPCRWTHLCFHELDIAMFERLPLASVQSLASDALPMMCRVTPCDDLAVTHRVAAAVNRLGWRTSGDEACLENTKGVVDRQCLSAALAIIPTCNPKVSGFEYAHGPVTPEVLATLMQHLTSHHPLINLVSFRQCAWAAAGGVWPVLLPSLPPTVTELHLSDDSVSRAQLEVMCVHACRPVKVCWESMSMTQEAWQAVWHQHVKDAMTAAGHQHVVLDAWLVPAAELVVAEDDDDDVDEDVGEDVGDEDDN